MVRPDANNVVFLAGSARSGTTWLSNLINFKNDYRYIFEPFWGEKVQMCRAFGTRQYLRSGTDDERYLGPARAIISGRVRNKWADQFNQNFDNRRILVKDIRANLILYWLRNWFPGMRFILLLRHPCAVALSRMRLQWKADLVRFSSQRDLVTDYLQPFLLELDSASDEFNKHVTSWCIENYVPLKLFAGHELHVAWYEYLCVEPRENLERLFSFLGSSLDERVFERLREPSPVSWNTSAVLAGADRVHGWKRQVTESQIRRASEILDRFGLSVLYSDDPLPNRDGLQAFLRRED